MRLLATKRIILVNLLWVDTYLKYFKKINDPVRRGMKSVVTTFFNGFRINRTIATAIRTLVATIVVFLVAACLQVSAEGVEQNISILQQNTLAQGNPLKNGISTPLSDNLLRSTKKFDLNVKNISIKSKREEKEDIFRTLNTFVLPDALIVVTGKVKDGNGKPLVGVSVSIVGEKGGVLTDEAGNFSIEVPENTSKLSFSYVGYKEVIISVNGKTSIEIIMTPEASSLSDVVVVGYGVQKKVNVIGSISQISSDELKGRPVPLLSNALAGQMSGVTVISRSGQPGVSSGTIRIRGVGSFGATPDALVLIDGIPGNVDDVNPEEVASISVLKDASSAAIYGARAANGVILITTKVGVSAKVRVTYNAYAGFETPTSLPKFLNSWDYALAFNEASGTQRYSPEDIVKFKDGSDPVNFPNSNMLRDVFSRNGFQTGHDLSFTGGSDVNKYYLSFGYLSQDGVVEKNNFTRYSARLNMISTLTKKIKVTTRLSGVSSLIKEPVSLNSLTKFDMLDGINQALRYPSVYTTVLPNGDYGIGPTSGGSPFAWFSSPSFYENPTWRFNGNVKVTYEPMKDFVLSAVGGYNFTHSESKRYSSTLRLNDDITIEPSALNQTSDIFQYQTFQTTADYNKKIGHHNFSGLLGYSFEKQKGRDLFAYRDNFPGNNLPYLDAGSPSNQLSSGGGYNWAIQSTFGRIRYNYNERYLFESTLRYDGSSRFPDTKKYGLFPSLAIGWRISEESFIKEKYGDWLDNLKLKASWGKLGNQNIGNYPWQSTYELSHDYVFGGVMTPGAALTTLIDQNLHWENTQTTDGGFESSMWGGKLNLNVSYFYRKTTDILYKPTTSVSTVLGMNLSEMNTGSLQNTGWEFEIGHRNKIGAFKYHLNGNFTIIHNKVLDLGIGNVTQPNGLVGNGLDLFIGYPMELYYGLVTDGVFLDQSDIDTWYLKNNQSSISPKAKARPGDFRYVDLSGDGKVDLNNDRKILGSNIPKYNFSVNMGFEYKGFDFSTMLQGVAGVNGFVGYYNGFAFYNLGNIQEWMWKGRFDPTSPTRNPEYPRLQILGNSVGVNGQLSDFWVLDASYLRIKNIQLGYSFSPRILKKIHVEGLRIYASGENMVTFDHYRPGWDPEFNSKVSSESPVYYPILATYTFGINLKL